MDNDRRIIFTADARFDMRIVEGKRPTLSGYALVWNTTSTDRGGYFVRLRPGSATFTTPTLAVYHHEVRDVIGNTENDTLRLTPDDYGVKFEIDLPDTQVGRDVHTLVRDKYVRGMSFAMTTKPKGRATRENGRDIFDAEAYTVDEISVTPTPAFITATVDVKADPQPATAHSARTSQAHQLNKLKLDLLALQGAEHPAAVK